MKILHFIYDHPQNPWCGGGGAIRTWRINSILARWGHEITVCCGAFPGCGALGHSEPFRVRFMGMETGNYKASRLMFSMFSSSLNKKGYDVIVEDFSAYSPVYFPMCPNNLVTVLHLHHGKQAFFLKGLLGSIAFINETLFLPRRKRVILVSPHLRRAVSTKALTTVIGQGVDLPQALPKPTEEFVLYVGRLDIYHKGLDTLIEAWGRMERRYPDIPLKIIGGGDLHGVKQLIAKSGAKNVEVTGRLPHEEVMREMNRAFFIVMPSRIEGLPLTACEALRLGKPVITSDIDAFSSLHSKGKVGIVVPMEDAEALQKAIETMLEQKELRRQIGEQARKIGQKFSWQQVARAQEDFYRLSLERIKALK